MAAVAYGHVAIVPKGIWNADIQYEVCQLVEYDGSSYVAKAQPPVGTLPTDTSYWQVSAAGTKKASSGSLGTVMPDGSTTEVNEEGKLSAKTAQQNALGVVKGSDDITVGEDGNLTVNTTFEQATEIANIIAGEAIKSVLGKVSKAIATTMSLDENALLKNMISGIDVNDGNKVPSSAYIHSLVERIGMGTALEGGFDNLTAGLNSVNNNLSKAVYCSDLLETSESARFVQWNGDTLNTPFKAGLTDCQEGFAFCYGNWNDYMTVIAFAKNSNKMWAWSKGVNAWIEYVTKSDLEPIQKGSVFLDNIGSLSSPSQLKHIGFYKFLTMTADVNADAETETMTEYATGDFYGLLLGGDTNTTDGCMYGTLIVSSPRINTGIWLCTIWQKKFIHWYKLNKA